MAIKRRQIFGVSQVTVYNPKTMEIYGDAEIIGTANISSTGELVENTGGASPYAYAVEDGLIKTEVSLSLGELPDWALQVFSGAKVTKNTAEPNGAVSKSLTNSDGSSVFDATTGIASATLKAGGAADLKTGRYVAIAVSATTVDIYAMTSLDFGRGAKMSYVDDSLKINATPLTITAGSATEIPALGVELNGGSGVIGMTVGDKAYFEVRSPNNGSSSIVVGSLTSKFVDVGLILAAQERSSGELFVIDVYRAKGVGVPIGLTAKEFSKSEITLTAFRDSERDGVYSITPIEKA